MKCYGVTQAFAWFFVGAAICVAGGILYIFMPTIVDEIMAMELALSKSSVIYPVWQEIPVPIYREYYLFNYTNAEDFMNDYSIVPEVEQCGPYVYRELRNKVFINWNSDGEYVQYRETHTYPFIPDLSNGAENDTIYTPNIPLATIFLMAEELGKTEKQNILEELQRGDDTYTSVIIQMEASTIIWHGYYDAIVDAGQKLIGEEILPGGMFALFYGKNATDDFKYEINRGTKDISQEFEILQWQNSETLPYWGDAYSYCNMINGSDGTMYNSKIDPDDRVYIFVSDMCRSIFLDYIDDRSYRGYKGHRFASNPLLFSDPGTYPDNECFCAPNGTGCFKPGISNLGPCKFDAPVYLSHPHYLWVDEDVQHSIKGLNPVEEYHRSEVNIEPNSGMLLWIDIRFQINVRVRPSIYKTLPDMLLPVIWLNETAELDDARINMLRNNLFIPMKIAYAVPIVLMSVGGAAALIGLLCMFSILCTKTGRKQD